MKRGIKLSIETIHLPSETFRVSGFRMLDKMGPDSVSILGLANLAFVQEFLRRGIKNVSELFEEATA